MSWLHFALLMAACVIWVLPDPGKMCPRLSPFLVFYATCLILLEYIFGLNLEDKELPQYDHIGLVRHDYPFPHLLLKVRWPKSRPGPCCIGSSGASLLLLPIIALFCHCDDLCRYQAVRVTTLTTFMQYWAF